MKKTEEMNKKWDKIENIKDEIFGEFNKNSNEYKNMNIEIMDKFDEFKKEYKIIRDKFFELADFIKDIRFQKNIKNLYSQILYRKSIKSICKSLNELNDIKNYNKGEEKDLELIKNISSIEKMNFRINKDNSEIKNNISQEFSSDELNEYIQNKKHKFKKSVEYNSPKKINKDNKISKLSFSKNNKTFDNNERQNNIYNKEINNATIYSYSSNNKKEKFQEKDREESQNNINNNNYKKKNQKIIIESKFDSPSQSINKTFNKPHNEDSNSMTSDNQSTNAHYNNSNSNTINDTNNYSFSSVNAFCLNTNNSNNKALINKTHLDSNDKVIKEMASELEQSTAKKDFKSLDKEKEKIEPKNLIKNNKKEQEIIDLELNNSNLSDDNVFINTGNKDDNIIKDKLHYSKKLKNENEKNIISPYTSLNKETKSNDFILYGNNPKAIDKKFFMTDKKLLDLEEFTRDKFNEIKNQIENLIVIKPNNNNPKKLTKSNTLSFNSFRDKGAFLSNNNKNENIISNNNNNTSFTNNLSNKIKSINQKIKENKNDIKNLENNNSEKEFDKTYQNFTKSKFYNFEQINQNIFNSSLKKITVNSIEQKEKEKNTVTPCVKEYIKSNKIVSRNDIRTLEHKNSDNNTFFEKKKWETIDSMRIKNNESKRQKNRNISSGNIYLTQKNGESISFNEADIKLVYLNKFVNKKLPYAPKDALLLEKK